MSIEQLLLFLLFVAIPLIEWLIRTMRARTGGSPGNQVPPPDRGTVPRSRASVPDVGTSEHVQASKREPHLPMPQRAAPMSGRPRDSLRPLARRRAVLPGDLRRAIVSIAVLGPCRALNPKDASQLD